MKFIALFFILFLFSLVESTLLPIPLVLLLVIVWSAHHTDHAVLWFAFLGGLFIDGMTGRVVGGSSIFFLTAVFILLSYGRTIKTQQVFLVVMYCLFAGTLYQYIFLHSVTLLGSIVLFISSLILYGLVALVTQQVTVHHDMQLEW